jgi:hypothetical protein
MGTVVWRFFETQARPLDDSSLVNRGEVVSRSWNKIHSYHDFDFLNSIQGRLETVLTPRNVSSTFLRAASSDTLARLLACAMMTR